MSQLPPVPSEDQADAFWNRKRIGLAVLAVLLVLILTLVLLVAFFGPTICCNVFSNVMDAL